MRSSTCRRTRGPWPPTICAARSANGPGTSWSRPAPGDADLGAVDVGSGTALGVAEAHGEACRRALERTPPPAAVISLAGIPLQEAPCLPPGSVHVAVSGTAMHWITEAAGLASTGSVFPGYPDHTDEAERRAWAAAAARQWERLLELRGVELAAGGRLVAAVPASPDPDPTGRGSTWSSSAI